MVGMLDSSHQGGVSFQDFARFVALLPEAQVPRQVPCGIQWGSRHDGCRFGRVSSPADLMSPASCMLVCACGCTGSGRLCGLLCLQAEARAILQMDRQCAFRQCPRRLHAVPAEAQRADLKASCSAGQAWQCAVLLGRLRGLAVQPGVQVGLASITSPEHAWGILIQVLIFSRPLSGGRSILTFAVCFSHSSIVYL